MSEQVELGGKYRDVVSGFVGVAIARAEYLYEEPSVLVAAETRQAAADSRWIAEARMAPLPPGSTGFGSS